MNRKFRGDYGVYCCPHVFNNERPILLVIRETDGEWQFLCGENDDIDECHHVGVGHLLERDSKLEKMADLAKATGAERKKNGDDWEYFDLEE